MSVLSRLALSAAFVAGLGLALPAMAADRPARSHGGTHSMPPRGFRSAPPGFHGRLPDVRRPGAAPRSSFAYPRRDLGTFRGRSFSRFSARDHTIWRGGAWRHVVHDGHLGWWWVVGGLWYFYPAPIYPYPTYIGPAYYYDYYTRYGAPSYYWYYCEDPPGYYPYVQQCNEPWEPVPPVPAP